MTIDFTVAICTYNGAERLPRLLEQLQHQVDTEAIQWEILVIDNNSSDETKRVVESFQRAWSGTGQIRYWFEPEQGLAIARQRATEDARGEWVGFLDDDNIPAQNWVAKAYEFAHTHSRVGAYGSRILGEFEVTPPTNFKRIAAYLALNDRGSKTSRYEPQRKVLPPGAGLVVRRQAWLENVPQRCFLQGRVSGPKLPGEDLEALLHIQRAGWEIWYNPAMQVTHQIPRHRLERTYLMNLCRGVGLSRYHTRMLSVERWQWPLMFPIYVLNDLRKLIIHLYRYRFAFKSDLVAACELELVIGSLVSPLYLWREYLKGYLQPQRQLQSTSVRPPNICC